MPVLSDDSQERAREEKCLADIAEHDLRVLRVHGDDAWSEFAYSVILYRRFGLPEVVIVGLRGERAHWTLNELAARARLGERFQAGAMVDGLLDGFQVTFRSVPMDHGVAHFGWAFWHYDGEFLPTLQSPPSSTCNRRAGIDPRAMRSGVRRDRKPTPPRTNHGDRPYESRDAAGL